MAAPIDRPGVVPFDDPVSRVHHHNWQPAVGQVEAGFCGARVIAMTVEHASTLPCCPMCAVVLDERGWTCIAREVA